MWRFIRACSWIALLSLFLTSLTSPVHAQSSAGTGPAAQSAMTSLATLPDFSYSGRGSAAEEPPTVTRETHTFFDVTESGAIPDDGLSDREAIELAIAAAEAHSQWH